MITEVKLNNCFIFSDSIELSLIADMRTKKFPYNVYSENNYNILKSVGIYGQNNAGKTCLIKSIKTIKNIILDIRNDLESNIFNDNKVANLEIAFLMDGIKYSYEIKYNSEKDEFLSERFIKYSKDDNSNIKLEDLLVRDTTNNKFYFYKDTHDNNIANVMKYISTNKIVINAMNATEFPELEKIKTILVNFAEKIDFVSNLVPVKKTIEILKSDDPKKEKIVGFIRHADLYLDDFGYNHNFIDDIKSIKKIADSEQENIDLDNKKAITTQELEQLSLYSTYKGIKVFSKYHDSIGTKKVTALASYVIDALEEGRILIIDEIDSSLHFKLVRSIINMFNNELNTKAQLIFTTHDVNLMDCKKMFRKEQIWFVHKDKDNQFVYSLADFTAQNGIRDTSDIIEKYKKGLLGAIPDPNMFESLLEVTGING